MNPLKDCTGTECTFGSLVSGLVGYINIIIPLLFGLILLILMWRLIDAWIINVGDQKKIDDGKSAALWGVIVLVVLTVVWGIVNLLKNAFFGV